MKLINLLHVLGLGIRCNIGFNDLSSWLINNVDVKTLLSSYRDIYDMEVINVHISDDDIVCIELENIKYY